MVGETYLRYRYSKDADKKLIRSAQIWTVEEHKIILSEVDPLAVYICDKLSREGFETYIVGGAVRDLLLKKHPKDFDIASAATPSRIKKIFSNSRIIGKRFRLVHIFFGDKIFEIATFRSAKDGATGNTFGRIEEDVLRRDFTMNALFYDPRKELVIDFVGGFHDINRKRIKSLIPMKIIFEEDPVRMVRAVKYAVISEFKIPFFLRKKIKESASLLNKISSSRLTEEMIKIIKSPCAAKIIEELEFLDLYIHFQPAAVALIKNSLQFRQRYYKTLSGLNRNDVHDCGKKNSSILSLGLSALVRDYIDDNIDWETAGEDNYKQMFALARKFVLPMNPPRIELGKAIHDIFAEHNINVKRWRCLDRL